MNNWKLPTSVHVAGVDWQIETDYKAVLDVLIQYNNPDYDNEEKLFYMLIGIVKDFDNLDPANYMEMANALCEFLDMGIEDNSPKPRVMDWEQDARIIIPEINKQIGNGMDVRNMDMHWWTFLGYYMGIGESTFAHVVSIRQKKAKHKKLEKWEKEFLQENKDTVILKEKLSRQEQEEKDALLALLDK